MSSIWAQVSVLSHFAEFVCLFVTVELGELGQAQVLSHATLGELHMGPSVCLVTTC